MLGSWILHADPKQASLPTNHSLLDSMSGVRAAFTASKLSLAEWWTIYFLCIANRHNYLLRFPYFEFRCTELWIFHSNQSALRVSCAGYQWGWGGSCWGCWDMYLFYPGVTSCYSQSRENLPMKLEPVVPHHQRTAGSGDAQTRSSKRRSQK